MIRGVVDVWSQQRRLEFRLHIHEDKGHTFFSENLELPLTLFVLGIVLCIIFPMLPDTAEKASTAGHGCRFNAPREGGRRKQ